MKTIVLAGGFATRLWPLTEKTAKPLLRVAGKPIITHIIEKLPPDAECIVSTNAVFADDFYAWQKADFPDRKVEVFVEDSHGEKGKKGALAAVSFVIEQFKIDDDVLVLAGDNLFLFSFDDFLARAKTNPLLAAYELNNLEAAKKFGVVVPGKDGLVSEFQEKPDQPKSSLVSTGCLYFPKRLLGQLIEYSRANNDDLGGVFEHYLSLNEPVEYFDFTERWFDIGSFGAFLDAQKYLIGKQTLDLGATKLGNNELHETVLLSPEVTIENATLQNAILERGAVVRNACVRNSVIGQNATVSGVDITGTALRAESFVAGEA
jgi:glucose-1-phosphate thymidylyltransferase